MRSSVHTPVRPMVIPRPVRIAWIGVGSVFAVLTLLWAAYLIADRLALTSDDLAFTYEAAEVTMVDIAVDSGTVTVVATDGPEAEVEMTVRRGLLSGSQHQDLVDGRLAIESTCPTIAQFNSCSTDVVVRAPAGVQVVAASHYGDVAVSDFTGDVSASSSSGSMRGVRLSGNVMFATNYGDVRLEGLAATVVSASTSSGNVVIEFAVEPHNVRATSSYGDLDIVVPESGVAYRLDLSSSYGDVAGDVRTDPTSDRAISASTSAGNVSVRYR